MKKIAIQDANILIDLLKTEMVELCLSLRYRFLTTDLIFQELYYEQQQLIRVFIESGSFEIIETSEEQLEEILKISVAYDNLSKEDVSALFHAEQLDALLLTGDKILRKIADSRQIKTAGTLWIFDELVASGILKRDEACTHLKTLMKTNQRLPRKDCEERLTAWGK